MPIEEPPYDNYPDLHKCEVKANLLKQDNKQLVAILDLLRKQSSEPIVQGADELARHLERIRRGFGEDSVSK